MNEHNIISVSGGKDSTALLLLALERETENLQAVFADTGNEHQITYEYIQYLNDKVFPIQIIKADFSKQIQKRRNYVLEHWKNKGKSTEEIEQAAAALTPTGNPFLDLCLLKGRFPSSMAAFCSAALKRDPIMQQIMNPLLHAGNDVISWQGIRADESRRRAALTESEFKKAINDAELWNYRPILQWSAQDYFDMHKKHGIEPNPLYKLGMARVGCMPCINCRKQELREISNRFPTEIDRIRVWEKLVGKASKRGKATFFPIRNIDEKVQWSKTSRGGQQYDAFADEVILCSSIYGLCE